MKDTFRKISAVVLIAVLLLSTTSFSVFKHFCNGNMVTISTEKVESCCESEITIKPINLNFSEQNCCKNETVQKDVLPFDYTKTVKITKSETLFLTSFYYNFIESLSVIKTKNNFYKDFSPPKLIFNKQVRFQSFLI
jgi:hypothetical protein